MNDEVISKYWNEGHFSTADNARDLAGRLSTKLEGVSAEDIVKDLFFAYSNGIKGEPLEPSSIAGKDVDGIARYARYYNDFYAFGKEAAEDIKRNTYDAKFEINKKYDIGIKDSKDPDKAKISFLYKNGGSAGYSYYAKTLADHKPNTGLYLDFGADEKLDAKDMNEVVRIAKMYAGIADDPEDDYDDEAAIIRQTQELYDNGDIDEEEYERRMDFIL
jgi:hypothetical protein